MLECSKQEGGRITARSRCTTGPGKGKRTIHGTLSCAFLNQAANSQAESQGQYQPTIHAGRAERVGGGGAHPRLPSDLNRPSAYKTCTTRQDACIKARKGGKGVEPRWRGHALVGRVQKGHPSQQGLIM